tara:strand:- start:476 stop:1477 length:1002 start_codon:yes stop_codon:yes gene_type:complete
VSYLDDKYLGLISPRLEKFRKIRGGVYNFRCPYCGDSQRHKNKARGYIYKNKADYNFKCHNCGVTRSFTYFLKDRDPPLYDEYVMERYKEGLTGKGTVTPEPNFTFVKPKFRKKDICDELVKISELNTSHRAKKYLINRGINEDTLSKFYYCPDFKRWTNKHKKIYDTTDNDDDRIIIPLRNSKGELFGYQGRSLDPTSKMRYITVMLDENAPKIYGLEKINTQKPIYILEGPFDSLFMENSVAMCGSDVDIRTFGWSSYIWVYDNEPRNREIVNRLERSINRGDQVVIWPSNIQEKDVNEMILAKHNICDIIKTNTFSELKAKLQLNLWKKV